MATIKNYTSLEQSKVLAEILPHESADMYYFLDPTPAGNIYHLVVQQIAFGVRTREPEYDKGDIPCWSLAALLNLMICPNLEEYIKGKWDLTTFTDESLKTPIEVQDCKDPVDACYEMILKLKELNLL